MNLFTKQKQIHRHRKQTMVSIQEGEWGGKNEEFGINRYTLLYMKWIKKQGSIAQHRELYSTSYSDL